MATVLPYSHMEPRVRWSMRQSKKACGKPQYFVNCRLRENAYNAGSESAACGYVNCIIQHAIAVNGNAAENGGNRTTERRPHGEGNR